MICVSYTRMVSGCIEKINSYPGAGTEKRESAIVPIADQNQKILRFAKKNHWDISKKYSDRKSDAEDETAFLQLAADGIARKFDVVIMWSMFFFGRNISSAGDLLRDVFYPAGIQFAVAEDNFCSIGKTEIEVMDYIEACQSRYRKSMHSQLCASYSESCKYKYFGYIWQPDGSLKINEESAPTVRKIFDMIKQGMILREIADALNRDEIETPMQYRARATGKSNAFESGPWKTCTIRSLLGKAFYTGTWIRKIGGDEIKLTCPVIIPDVEYRAAMEILATRSNTSKPRNERCKAYFSSLIFDGVSGEKLRANRKLTDGIEVYCPNVNLRSVIVDEGKNIRADVVLQTVLSKLSEERVAAENGKIFLHSEAGKLYAEEMKHAVRDRMLELLYQMGELEGRLIQSNEASVLHEKMLNLENLMTKAEEEMERMDLMFSDENPWIQLFSGFDAHEKFSKVYFKKYLYRVEVREFSDVTVFLNLQEWKIRPRNADEVENYG